MVATPQQALTEPLSGTIRDQALAARVAARVLAKSHTEQRQRVLLAVAEQLVQDAPSVLRANALDVEQERANDGSPSTIDRLTLTPARIQASAEDVRQVVQLPDPLAELGPMRTLANGMRVGQQRVPLGVVAIIYEGRPNVTIDAAVLCIKSGNAVVLRGSSSALHSNRALVALMQRALSSAGLPEACIQLVNSASRDAIGELLSLRGLIDVAIPRGGAGLIRYVAEHARVPVIETGAGVCHTFIDAQADPGMAIDIVFNAKVRRPSICNALDTVLIDRSIAPVLLPAIAARLWQAGVCLHGDLPACELLASQAPAGLLIAATSSDWGHEYLSLDAAVALVDGLDGALQHIEAHGSGHSEAIVTQDYEHAMRFVNDVDAAAVYVNASTQFTDGAQFGLGAEIGISTQRLHARGPMGLREMTTYKWVVLGNGQVRPA